VLQHLRQRLPNPRFVVDHQDVGFHPDLPSWLGNERKSLGPVASIGRRFIAMSATSGTVDFRHADAGKRDGRNCAISSGASPAVPV
jgi:hypothetical protein